MDNITSIKKFIVTSFKFHGLSIGRFHNIKIMSVLERTGSASCLQTRLILNCRLLLQMMQTVGKLIGLNDACEYFATQLNPLDENEREEWIDKTVDYIQKQSIESPFVEKDLIESAILDSCKLETEENVTIFNVISAFDIPQFTYNIDRKKFLSCSRKRQLFASPDSKCRMFRDRYAILRQRTLRHELFSSGQQFQLQPVEYLLSAGVAVSRVVVLGMLTQLKENRFYIEDPSGCVPLDLTTTNYHTGFFTESSFVLVEGNYKDGAIHVQALGFPPPEKSEISRIYFGTNNIFGGLDELNVKSSEKLKMIEAKNAEAMIVFISDIWLDQHKVIEKLTKLFAGYDSVPPTAMVLMGNFISSQQGCQQSLAALLKAKFKLLADLLAQYPNLIAQTRFVIVPGPADCLTANILPRPALIPFFTEDLVKKVPNIEFTTNPCRIQYCTQEIVILREDVVTKLCRNCIHFPTADDIPDHFAKTVTAQAHLAPLPACVCPVYWDHDAALRLYPLPDLVVVADQIKAFTASHAGCSIANPGSFSKAGFGFKVYYPASKVIEDSQIPEDSE